MVALPDAILVLCPAATFGRTGTVQLVDHGDGNGPAVAGWNTAALGPQPTPQQLAAVTAAQVTTHYAGRQGVAAKAHVDDPTGDATVLAAGGADLALIQNINEVRSLVNKLKAAVNALSPNAVTDADLAIVGPTTDGPGYVKAGIDALTGQ